MGLGIYFNSSLQQIKSFSEQFGDKKSLVMVNQSGLINGRTGEMRVVTSTSPEAIASGYKKLNSAQKADLRNNVRMFFYDSICKQFGGENKIPQALLEKLQSFKNPTGKALKNRDVKVILNTVGTSIRSSPKLYAANIFNGLKEITADEHLSADEKRSNIKNLLDGFLDQFNPSGATNPTLEANVETLADYLCDGNYKDGLNLLVRWVKNAMEDADPGARRSLKYQNEMVEELKKLAQPYSLSAKKETKQFVDALYNIKESSYEEDTKKLLGKNLLLDFCAKMTPLGSSKELSELYKSIKGDEILASLVQSDDNKDALDKKLKEIFIGKEMQFFPKDKSLRKKCNNELSNQIQLRINQNQSAKVENGPMIEEQPSQNNSRIVENDNKPAEIEVPNQQTIVLDKTQFHEEAIIPEQAPDPIPEIKLDNKWHAQEAVTTVKGKLHSIATSNLSPQEKTDSIRSYMDKVFNKAFPNDKIRGNKTNFRQFDFKEVFWIPPEMTGDLARSEGFVRHQLHNIGMKYLAETQTPYDSPLNQFFEKLAPKETEW